MKFIGQHIVDLISRFRNDIHLEKVDSGTIASGGNLGLDSNNKVVKAAISSADGMGSGFTVSATTDSNATTITQGDDLMFTAGTGITCETTADGTVTITNTVADTNTNQLTEFTLTGDSGSNQTVAHGNTLDIAGGNAISTVVGATDTVTINHDDTSSQSSVDNSGRTFIQDITLDTYGHVTGITSATDADTYEGDITGVSITTDSGGGSKAEDTSGSADFSILGSTGVDVTNSGTTITVTAVPGEIDHDSLNNFEANEHFTQANITTVGTVGTGAWEGTAISTDYTKHLVHFEFKGYAIGDGSNFERQQGLTDGQAPFEHNTSCGSDGLDATDVSNLFRTGGTVMAKAGTIKRIVGWAAGSGSSATCEIQFVKATHVRNDSANVTPVLLEGWSFTALGNDKMEDFDETSFTQASVAKGDIIYTQIKTSGSGVVVYFNSTMEIEF